jgi:hypothetical protein
VIYARIKLHGGATYVQPLDELDVLSEEIQNAAECDDIGARWTVELVRMTEREYKALPEFVGH